MRRVFRFDDMSINSDLETAERMSAMLSGLGEVWWCISPLVHDLSALEGAARQRVFPPIYKALSDQRCFYRVDRVGVPSVPPGVERASHGLLHLDHRLLGREAQELSILTSCELVRAKRFVPPFNKYDANTIDICREHGIDLVRFEDGWLSMEHNPYRREHERWYCHPREFSAAKLDLWLGPR